MKAAWADCYLIAQFGRAVEEAGIPRKRDAKCPAIVKFDPHLIVVKANACGSNQSVHANRILKAEKTSQDQLILLQQGASLRRAIAPSIFHTVPYHLSSLSEVRRRVWLRVAHRVKMYRL